MNERCRKCKLPVKEHEDQDGHWSCDACGCVFHDECEICHTLESGERICDDCFQTAIKRGENWDE